MSPRVSVILPTYNRASLVPRAIESVLAQTFADWQLIVVDDGSTDDTRSVVGGYADSRIRYLLLAENRGVCHARNEGIAATQSELVAFLDSDDYFEPAKLESQVERFDVNPHALSDLGVVLGVTQWLTNPEIVARANGDTPWDGRVSALIHKYPRHTWSTMMVTRRHLDMVGGFDPRLRASEFFDLVIRLAAVCRFDASANAVTVLDPEADRQNRGWTQASSAAAAEVLVDKYRFDGLPARRTRADLFMKLARQRAAEDGLRAAVRPIAQAFMSSPDPRLLRTPGRLIVDRFGGRRPG